MRLQAFPGQRSPAGLAALLSIPMTLAVPDACLFAGEGEGGDDSSGRPRIQFYVPEVAAHRGEIISLPSRVSTEVPLSLAAFSLEYDTSVLSVEPPSVSSEVQEILEATPGADSLFLWFFDADLGWLQVYLVMDFQAGPSSVIPAGDTPVALLRFQVKDDAPEGRYDLKFTRKESANYDGEFNDSDDNPVYNHARQDGVEFDDQTDFDGGQEPELIDGAIVISIIGDVSVFARGDVNADRQIDISDPIRLLGYLFIGEVSITCGDAADANDDGSLDLSDSIYMLAYLFERRDTNSSMSIVPAPDPTPDSLGCARY